jgi:hypothetical protein
MTSMPTLDVVREPAALTALALNSTRSTDSLGEAIAELAARLYAATYELLVLLREFDERAGWNCGFLSCAHWLHWRTGIDLGAAREKVRVAKALVSLPFVSAAMRRGAISYAKVRALTRVATPENESALLDFALTGTAAHVERFVRAWRRVDRVADARQTEVRHLRRELSTWVDDDGMVVIRGRLTPDVGAIVQRALEAAADRLYREAASAPSGAAVTEDVTFRQRRADALRLLAEAALASDFDPGTSGDRYQVVLHIEADGLPSDAPCSPERRLAREAAVPDAASPGIEPHLLDGTLEVADGGIHISAEVRHVMGIAATSGAAGKSTTRVACEQRASNGRRNRSRLPAHVEQLPVAVWRITTVDVSHDSRRDTARASRAGPLLRPTEAASAWPSRARWWPTTAAR